MFTVISIMFVGIAVGFAGKKISFLSYIHQSISVTICCLLFFLGLSVGKNDHLISHFPVLGGQALLLAFLGTLGSVLAGWLVWRYFWKKGGNP